MFLFVQKALDDLGQILGAVVGVIVQKERAGGVPAEHMGPAVDRQPHPLQGSDPGHQELSGQTGT